MQKQTDEMNRLKNEWTVTKTPNVKRKDTLQKNTKLTERMGSDTDAKEIGRIAIVFRAKTVHFKKYGKQNFVDTTYSRYYNKKVLKLQNRSTPAFVWLWRKSMQKDIQRVSRCRN